MKSLKIIKNNSIRISSLRMADIHEWVFAGKDEKSLRGVGRIILTRRQRKVEFRTNLEASSERLWQIATKVSNYPRYFKYVHYAKEPENFKKGTVWWDISTIVYFPMKVSHRVVQVVPGREVRHEISLPLGGQIVQNFKIEPTSGGTKVEIKVLISQNKLMDFLLGRVIEARTNSIVLGALERAEKEIGEGIFEEADVHKGKGILAKLIIPNSRHMILPISVFFGVLVTLAVIVGFNMPSEVKAAPGRVISKVKPKIMASRGVSKIKTEFDKVEYKFQQVVN
ncbi:MAG: hypothetical protein UT84_C0003G0056 [Candidatus Curtissbacteria bacterium GW2011_GWA1_40_16]|uniref:Coenzyme Q-binding protein COQ10 START domain-containing protein n=1 Tax=Candidatus Curtissbacteria bacterium GW2011_GWA1_40_16 TaxID=1618405 RepID=A0A0G0RMD4_9BACT|nr:MAG: hypothetical protein UT84_C0003G0056 [Candidatus Curtissbacteria bacterium GW2011_GWA1_40_16]